MKHFSNRTKEILPILLTWIFFTAIVPSRAQPRLSGMSMYASKSDGTQGNGGNQSTWNTLGRGNNDSFNIYFFLGPMEVPIFINGGDSDDTLNPKYSLTPGTHRIGFAVSQGPTITPNDFLGLNLYFDDDLKTNRVSAVLRANGSTLFSTVGSSIRTFGENRFQNGANTLTYVRGEWKVTLTGLQIRRPFADIVSPFATVKDGAFDVVGSLTLSVEGPDPVPVLEPRLDSKWVVQSTGSGDSSMPIGIGRDDVGSVYMLSEFTGQFVLGSGPVTASGARDTALTKLNRDGTTAWVRTYGNGQNVRAWGGLGVDRDGNSYFPVIFNGRVVLGSTVLNPAPGLNHFAIVCVGPDGEVRWVCPVIGQGPAWDQAFATCAIPSGGCLVTGHIGGTVPIRTTSVTSVGGDDLVVIRLDRDGKLVWVRRAGGLANEQGKAICTDAENNAYVAGFFASPKMTFPGNNPIAHSSSGSLDVFIAKYNAAGVLLWAVSAGGAGSDVANSVAVDGQGRCYVGGTFTGSAHFGTNVLTAPGTGYFLCRYSGEGVLEWARSLENASGSPILAANRQGELFLSTTLAGRINFGTNSVKGPSARNLMVARLKDGTELTWSQVYPSSQGVSPGALSLAGTGDLVVGGSYKLSLGITETFLTNPVNPAGHSLFAIKFSEPLAQQIAVGESGVRIAVRGELGLPFEITARDELMSPSTWVSPKSVIGIEPTEITLRDETAPQRFYQVRAR